MPHLYDACAKKIGCCPLCLEHATMKRHTWMSSNAGLLRCEHVAFKHASVNAGSNRCGLRARQRVWGAESMQLGRGQLLNTMYKDLTALCPCMGRALL